jgi:small-conductance mechanosensitive channel
MDRVLTDDPRRTREQFSSIAIGVAQAVLILLIATVLARPLRGCLRRRLARTLAPEYARRTAQNLVEAGIFGVALPLILNLMGVSVIWTTLLAAVGRSTLVVAMGLQDVFQRLVAGGFIHFECSYNVGDHIKFSVHDVEGTVAEIAFRTTVIRTDDGTRVVTPNWFIFTQAVDDYSPERAVLSDVTAPATGGSLARRQTCGQSSMQRSPMCPGSLLYPTSWSRQASSTSACRSGSRRNPESAHRRST